MQQDFDREVLSRLPLAEDVLLLCQVVCHDPSRDDRSDRRRGRTYQKKSTFPLLAQLVRDALLQPKGSGPKSSCHPQQQGTLPAVLSSTQDKLGHLPLAVSEAFLTEDADRLRPVFPDTHGATLQDPIAPTLRDCEVLVLDGPVVKRVPRRLQPTRQRPGGLRGGKGLAALHLRSGLVLALATDPDGEANDAQLVPDLLPPVRTPIAGPRLGRADRPLCDRMHTAALVAEEGDHFRVRYPSKVPFYPDPARPAQQGRDNPGRVYEQPGGWLGGERDKRRRSVRRVTRHRDGEEAVLLVTDLLDPARYKAKDLRTLYLAWWGMERVLQQITEGFPLHGRIAPTRQGTLLQRSFGLLLYDRIPGVRGQVAVGQGHAVAVLCTESLLGDVSKQLVALNELVAAVGVVELLPAVYWAAAVRQHWQRLLGGVWSARWIKAPGRKRQPPAPKQGKRDHTSVYRLLNAHRQSQRKATVT